MKVLALGLALGLAACGGGQGFHYVRTAVNAPATARIAITSYSDDTLGLSIANDSDGTLTFSPPSVRASDEARSMPCFGATVTLAKGETTEVSVRCNWSSFRTGQLLKISFEDSVQTSAGPVRVPPLLLRVAHTPD